MKARIVRYRISLVILAALLFGAITPGLLHAQAAAPAASSTQDQSATPAKTRKSRKKKAAADAAAAAPASPTPAPAASTAPAAAPAPAMTAMTPKTHKTSSTVQAQTPPSPGMVWVNSGTGVYHKEGSRWYGKTKTGKWMTEQDAMKAGYKAAKN